MRLQPRKSYDAFGGDGGEGRKIDERGKGDGEMEKSRNKRMMKET